MKKITLLLSLVALGSFAQAKSMEPMPDSIQWRQSALPGYQLVLQKCTTCHSAHYAQYQPPNTGVGYWNAQVLRMKNVFKAPITDEEIPVIVEYLNTTYGPNRKQKFKFKFKFSNAPQSLSDTLHGAHTLMQPQMDSLQNEFISFGKTLALHFFLMALNIKLKFFWLHPKPAYLFIACYPEAEVKKYKK